MAIEVVPSTDLDTDIAAYQADGFRLDIIFPADSPRVAELSHGDAAVRLELPDSADPVSEGRHSVVVTRGGDWGEGRAGMYYRDLIPDRQGGQYIASHIRIAEPGPVPDYVHHHDIAFQMIFCRRGRVEVVYEDQGPSFWMEPGDCVLQPPHIRHRVLNSDDGLEVVEIAGPAEHPTFVEHEIELPTDFYRPDRVFGGQRFSFDRANETSWQQSEFDGWSQRVTGILDATGGTANVRVLRCGKGAPDIAVTQENALCLLFVLEGEAVLRVSGDEHHLTLDDAAAIPRGLAWSLASPTGAELLQVTVREDTT